MVYHKLKLVGKQKLFSILILPVRTNRYNLNKDIHKFIKIKLWKNDYIICPNDLIFKNVFRSKGLNNDSSIYLGRSFSAKGFFNNNSYQNNNILKKSITDTKSMKCRSEEIFLKTTLST